jgi:large subunit ribosomal protein L14
MIQKGTYLLVIDNSGAKKVGCIHIYGGFKKKYAKSRDVILVTTKILRTKRRSSVKVKKGEVVKALVVQTIFPEFSFCGNRLCFNSNTAVLLNKNLRPIGSRIFGGVPSYFRYTKFLRIISISSGIIA